MRRLLTLTFLAALMAAPTGVSASSPAGVSRAILNIPRLHLKERVTMNLDAGPAFWPVTGRPGGGDTVAIAGHRTTHTRPFTYLNELERGDTVFVRYQGRTFRYVVTSRRIVSARDMHIADAVGHERLLLTACSRLDGTPTSASWRIVVYALPSR